MLPAIKLSNPVLMVMPHSYYTVLVPAHSHLVAVLAGRMKVGWVLGLAHNSPGPNSFRNYIQSAGCLMCSGDSGANAWVPVAKNTSHTDLTGLAGLGEGAGNSVVPAAREVVGKSGVLAGKEEAGTY